ncbi:SIS domain-containing protein [Deinococcus hopiensis]|uniref:Phospho-glucose isomerase C-terminal SIS domain-containing protein n=1 Tax=Deinococcus hopiensis KR-140 TaxID=695939 RepID=A0A1W1VMK3_9DEIO|nr:SIS domain-containing protein [Deinococcus hopiensis]SMB94556.1 phospho-glucose isomerase C-terminal SIS domain-containing protein [Deinococcus hopiensis KR-140]
MNLLTLLERLPGSYAGPTGAEPAPYALIGVGEGTLAAHLAATFAPLTLTRSGTQFVVSSADAADVARDYADLAEVGGANVRRVSTGGSPDDVDVLVPGGLVTPYHAAQYLAHATGHAQAAADAELLLANLRDRCAPHVEEANPARDLAWTLWGRMPLLFASPDAEALPHAWQSVLARVGKTLAVPVLGDPLAVVTGAFEAQHEKGDAKVALFLGDVDAALGVVREVLESRIDEVVHVPYPEGVGPEQVGGYAPQLALWYFGAWVATYLAERYDVDAADPPMLARAQAALAGEPGELNLSAPREDVRRTDVVQGWTDEDGANEDRTDDFDTEESDADYDGE